MESEKGTSREEELADLEKKVLDENLEVGASRRAASLGEIIADEEKYDKERGLMLNQAADWFSKVYGEVLSQKLPRYADDYPGDRGMYIASEKGEVVGGKWEDDGGILESDRGVRDARQAYLDALQRVIRTMRSQASIPSERVNSLQNESTNAEWKPAPTEDGADAAPAEPSAEAEESTKDGDAAPAAPAEEPTKNNY